MRHLSRNLALAITICAAPLASADTAICTGPLTLVANHANGINGLYVAVGSSNSIRVCSFNVTQFTVTAEDCKNMASIAALAFATQDPVTFYVDNAPSTACSSIPALFVANTRYFAVSK